MLIWVDGFDELPLSGGTGRANSSGYQGSQGFSVTTSTRTGNGRAIFLSENTLAAAIGRITKTIPSRDEIILGFGFKNNSTIRYREFLNFRFDNFAGTVRTHLKVAINDSAGISVFNGQTGTLLGATEVAAIQQDVWHYMEVRVKIGDADGEVEIRIDECVKLSLTNVDTKHDSATGVINQIFFDATSGGFVERGVSLDDFYIVDKEVGEYTDFLGDVAVATLFPNAAGDDSDFTVVNESANYLAVDEVESDEDSTYVVSDTVNHKDFYNIDDVPANVLEVLAVQATARVRKEGAGGGQFRINIKNGVTEGNGETKFTSTVYATYHEVFELDATGASWTVINADATQVGIEVL